MPPTPSSGTGYAGRQPVIPVRDFLDREAISYYTVHSTTALHTLVAVTMQLMEHE